MASWSLDLSCRSIQELSPLQQCTALEQLVIEGYYIHWQLVVDFLPHLAPALSHSLRQLTIKQATLHDGAHDTQIQLLHSLSLLTRLQGLTLLLPNFEPEPRDEDSLWNRVASALSHLKDLHKLDLRQNRIGNGMIPVAAAIAQLSQLHTLQLPANDLGSREFAAIGQAIAALPPRPMHLDLGYNKLTAGGVSALAPALRCHAATLSSLHLSHVWLGEQGSKVLAPALGCCSVLKSLDLASNGLDAEGAAVLVKSLSNIGGSLTSLNLSGNNINQRAAGEALTPALQAMSKLEHLDISSTNLGHEGLQILVPVLQMLRRLQSWDVSGSDLGCEGARILVIAVPTLTALTTLRVSLLGLQEGMAVLEEAADAMPNLNVVHT